MKELIGKLRYMGRQYSAGNHSRGGGGQKHYLEEAADELERLTTALNKYSEDEVLCAKDAEIEAQATEIEALRQDGSRLTAERDSLKEGLDGWHSRYLDCEVERDAARSAALAEGVRAGQFAAENAALKRAVLSVHEAKVRYHSQIAMCDLYDLCGLKNERPTK